MFATGGGGPPLGTSDGAIVVPFFSGIAGTIREGGEGSLCSSPLVIFSFVASFISSETCSVPCPCSDTCSVVCFGVCSVFICSVSFTILFPRVALSPVSV